MFIIMRLLAHIFIFSKTFRYACLSAMVNTLPQKSKKHWGGRAFLESTVLFKTLQQYTFLIFVSYSSLDSLDVTSTNHIHPSHQNFIIVVSSKTRNIETYP